MARIGLFGGTFDPPHRGHTEACEAFIRALSLDRLIVVPAYRQPGREKTAAPAEHRLAMSVLAFGALSSLCRIEISDAECSRGGKSYTADTLRTLAREKDDTLFLLIGADKLQNILQWYRLEEILKTAHLCVCRRNGISVNETVLSALREKYGVGVPLLSADLPAVSSTEIRGRLQSGEDPGALPLVPAVADYIKEKGLYR